MKLKKYFLSTYIVCILLLSCNANKAIKSNTNLLQGSWELIYISDSKIAFEGLFPNKKPNIVFDLESNRVSGNNSCNNYSGALHIIENTIDFKAPMVVTKMFCKDNQGERVYMQTLQKTKKYFVSKDGRVLQLIMNDVVLMRFKKL
jgi:heat shock protein HslJ